MNKYIIGVIVVAVVAAGAWYLSADRAPGTNGEVTDRPQTDETNDAVGQNVEVVYTDGGFSPTEVRVKAGMLVEFKNQGSRDMWPASNPHPIHNILPVFDAKQAITPGQSYSFTFTELGTWNYHDHLTARLGGTVIVE